jgi:hypothetical protein
MSTVGTGIQFFLNGFSSLDQPTNFKVWYDFKSGHMDVSNRVVFSQSGANPLFSGLAGNSTILSNSRDSAEFISQTGYIQILNSTGLNSSDFTHIFLNDKSTNNRWVIFDSLNTGAVAGNNVYKGYTLGYNDAGNPFFQYYGGSGWEVLTTNFIPYQYHSLYFKKQGEELLIGQYNFYNGEITNNTFPLDSALLFDSSGWFLSKSTGNNFYPHFSSSDTGLRIDEYLYFSTALSEYDIELVNSGFFSYPTGGGTVTGITSIPFTTGITTGVVVSGSGAFLQFTGTYTDVFCNVVSGYTTLYSGANVTGTGIVYITGEQLVTGVTGVDRSIVIDTGLLRSWYPTEIAYLRPVEKLDVMSMDFETGRIDGYDYPIRGIFDIVEGEFVVQSPTGQEINAWANGISIVSGNQLNSGSNYIPIYYLDRDYYRTGQLLDAKDFYSGIDNNITYRPTAPFFFHYQTGFSHVGTGNQTISWPASYYNYYPIVTFNGQKLLASSGNEAQQGTANVKLNSGSGFLFFSGNPLFSGITGNLYIYFLTGSFAGVTGTYSNTGVANSGIIGLRGFNPYHSLVFMNGQLQELDEDYVISSKTSRLNNSGVFTFSDNIIYNNNLSNELFFD